MSEIHFETPRLLIRELQTGEGEAVFKTSTFSELGAESYVEEARLESEKAPRSVFYLGIVQKESQKLIGCLEYQVFDPYHLIGEIGYWIGPQFQKQGFATEAVQAMTKYFFRHFKVERIQATSAPENSFSHRVLEKAGYQKEGYLRKNLRIGNERRDSLLFAVLREDLKEDSGSNSGSVS
jgi:ribosomal-protein-alanine N-acetyltransferase